MSYRIPDHQKSCRFERDNVDWVPYGMGNTAMHTFECVFEGSEEVGNLVEKYMDGPVFKSKGCKVTCPGYVAIETRICHKHDYEYTDVCGKCVQEETE